VKAIFSVLSLVLFLEMSALIQRIPPVLIRSSKSREFERILIVLKSLMRPMLVCDTTGLPLSNKATSSRFLAGGVNTFQMFRCNSLSSMFCSHVYAEIG